MVLQCERVWGLECLYRGVCQRVRILRCVQCCVKVGKRLDGSTSFCTGIVICEWNQLNLQLCHWFLGHWSKLSKCWSEHILNETIGNNAQNTLFWNLYSAIKKALFITFFLPFLAFYFRTLSADLLFVLKKKKNWVWLRPVTVSNAVLFLFYSSDN